jgi:gluconolactonase
VAFGLRFPEGPVALPDGSILLVELAGGVVTRIDPHGRAEVVADCGGGPNGLAIGPDGCAYVCNSGGAFEWPGLENFRIGSGVSSRWRGGSLDRVDLTTGDVTTLYTRCGRHRLLSLNDLVFDEDGGCFVTDTGIRTIRTAKRGAVYYCSPDGTRIREVIAPLEAPNGIGLSPDGSRLYVSETWTARVWWWPVESSGRVGRPNQISEHGGNLLVGLPGLQGLDSLAVDADGWVNVGTLVNGGITAISPDGSTVERMSLPDPLVTNLCFGRSDLRSAFVTLSGTGQLLEVPWPRQGLLPHFSARVRS